MSVLLFILYLFKNCFLFCFNGYLPYSIIAGKLQLGYASSISSWCIWKYRIRILCNYVVLAGASGGTRAICSILWETSPWHGPAVTLVTLELVGGEEATHLRDTRDLTGTVYFDLEWDTEGSQSSLRETPSSFPLGWDQLNLSLWERAKGAEERDEVAQRWRALNRKWDLVRFSLVPQFVLCHWRCEDRLDELLGSAWG